LNSWCGIRIFGVYLLFGSPLADLPGRPDLAPTTVRREDEEPADDEDEASAECGSNGLEPEDRISSALAGGEKEVRSYDEQEKADEHRRPDAQRLPDPHAHRWGNGRTPLNSRNLRRRE